MHVIQRLLIAGAALVLPLSPVAASPNVVVSIKPLHAIVASIMEGVGDPYLLVRDSQSPHTHRLKPSQVRRLRNADIIFWIGRNPESSLVKSIRVLGRNARTVAMSTQPGVIHHRLRRAGLWEDRAMKNHSVKGQQDFQDNSDHRSHVDGHIWMDPRNGMTFARIAAQVLIRKDPGSADAYRTNLRTTLARIAVADKQASAILAPVRGRRFIVFHDAFQYFEKRFGLAGIGSITLEGRTPGARRLRRIRNRIASHQIRCVFTEPQFAPRLARTVVDGTQARIAAVDPLGSGLSPGKGAYTRLILDAAKAFAACLK